ncbi:palmitoyl-monogalactosyldiacylglycerol delta-7 desaturase chloroplastic [Prunus yedoensis var. nudiflora]|uniref:Palmitoyl-monogalactosyldiacylglycerol delta-7 desaturase chloroplastic n=1 Tax=Prunus yedoensis var. nudiflora TaxID=2094558 RepID=A0A314Z373_PRUYE|nr:palmitoyl-monogalactosyldiacylglycerol delta-7 desaturase chloroplastic [Prunus yedoensis var. nudiflora]
MDLITSPPANPKTHHCFPLHRTFKPARKTRFGVQAIASEFQEPEAETEPGKYRRILLSDVIVKRPRNVFMGREWNLRDMATAGVESFTQEFQAPKWLEYLFAYCAVQALQGSPIDWVSTHRYHHQFCDSERDPHSPIEGFWVSHISWLFDTNSVAERCGGSNNAGDLEKQPFYKLIQKTYIAHPIVLGILLYAMGGFPFLVWGMGVRIVWVYHITWLVNSACHVWGKQAWNTCDLSRNNWWVALLAFGEGWHNNHHAFEYSARHGLHWWQLDMTWYVVRFLQAIGLATDVKLPTEAHKQRMALN